MTGKRRIARLGIVVAAAVVVVILGKRWPREQTVHYVLGDFAPSVSEINARWAQGRVIAPDTWIREVTFHYPSGQAPRIVTEEERLADGEYTVEVVVVADKGKSIVRKQLALRGGATSIDLEPPAVQ